MTANTGEKFGSVVFLFLILIANCKADTYILPPDDVDLIGETQYTAAGSEDTLLDIARRFNLGQNEIVNANPEVDRWLPGANTQVLLPKRHILPKATRNGIVINIAEMRLFYFPGPTKTQTPAVITHPVSIGRMDWTTPLGEAKIIGKTKNPTWRPPESIKEEHAAKGDPLPDVVPPGPDNPLGGYAMRLSIPGYLIHSTNKPYGIGMRVTHGCIRMYPEDIENLFPNIAVGTPIQIVNQSIKLGWIADTLYVEVHPPFDLTDYDYNESLDTALDLIAEINFSEVPILDGYKLRAALKEQLGVPIAIAHRSDIKKPLVQNENVASIGAALTSN